MKRSNKEIFWLILVCILVFFINLDAIFVNIMEARNFITAREMLHEGNWIFTTINDAPRYQKPPLPTWLTAFSGWTLGLDSLFALRLPAALLGMVSVLMTYKIALQITENKLFSFITGLIAVTSFHIILSGRDGQWDIFTHGFLLVSIVFIIKLFRESSNRYLYASIAGLFIGFSFLSKGPVSIYALLLPFLIAFGVVYGFKKGRLFPVLLGLIIAFLISGSWSLYVYFFDTQAVKKITSVEAGRWINYNVRPFYYYWSFVIQSGLWTITAFVSLLYPYLKNRVFYKKGYQFSLWWTLASVILLSVIPEKKSRYLLPVLFPLAITTAFYVEYLFRSFKTLKAKESWPVYLHFGIIALIGLVFPVAAYFYLESQLADQLIWLVLTGLSLFGLGVYMLIHLFSKNICKVFYASIIFVIAILCFGLPVADTISPNPDYRGTEIIDAHRKALDVPVYEFFGFTPELIWDYGQSIPILRDGNDYPIPPDDAFLLLVENREKELKEVSEVFASLSMQRLDSIDINPVAKKKTRLTRVLFYLEKQ